jgi:hypothetical protein
MTILKTIILGAIFGMLLSPSPSHAFLSNPSSQATAGSVSPRLGADPTGAISLIWKQERDSQSGHMFFNRSTDRGQSWQQKARGLDREKPAGSRSSSPRVDSDGKGNVVAAWWTKHRDGKKDVLFSASGDFGASFGRRCQLIRGDLVGRQQRVKSGPASD